MSLAASGEDGEPGRFPQISGLRFEYDVKRPAGSRVVTVTVGGTPLDEAKTYTVATSDFLVSRSGDGYTMFKEGKVLGSASAFPRTRTFSRRPYGRRRMRPLLPCLMAASSG